MSNIPNGFYPARAVKAALGKTSKGNEQVAVEFELLDSPQLPHITWYGYFTDKGQNITFKALRTMGWEGNDLTDLSSIEAKGVTVDLTIEQEEYEGKWRSKVKWVNTPGGLAVQNQLGGDELKAFAAKMKGAILAFDQQESAPKTTGKPAPKQTYKPRQQQAEDELPDVPF